NYQIGLNSEIAWDIDADLGAVSGRLDLSEVMIDSLNLNLGASNLEIVLGDKNEMSEIIIDAGTSSLDFIIPKGLGVKLKVDGFISKNSIDKLGWQLQNGYYITPDYNNAPRKALIDIDLGVGKLDIRVR
ncbi:MAG: hypothetical protein KGZ81_05990, partial [Flavobacteriales bacterium]|nr:hypothetical protein [Flavobacteriales bacterium]